MEQEPEELQIEDTVDEDEVLIEYDIATYPSDFTLCETLGTLILTMHYLFCDQLIHSG